MDYTIHLRMRIRFHRSGEKCVGAVSNELMTAPAGKQVIAPVPLERGSARGKFRTRERVQ